MPQILTISINGVVYTITLFWCDLVTGSDEGGWVMNIGDAQNNPIINGIPLVTGADLLAQYDYLGFGAQMFIQSATDPDAVPGYYDLGNNTQIYVTTVNE